MISTAQRFSDHLSPFRIVYPTIGFNCKNLLPLKGNVLWKIESGIARSFTWDEEGRVITLGFWSQGDVIGQSLSRMRPYYVECLTPIKIQEFALEGNDLQQALLTHIWKSEELLRIIHQPSISDRLLHLLAWLSYRFGQPTAQGALLNLRLTHQDFADTIATTRVTVTRLLRQFEQQGKIERLRNSPGVKLQHQSRGLSRQSLIFKQI
jgi:CRP-like cAMP-binding protein